MSGLKARLSWGIPISIGVIVLLSLDISGVGSGWGVRILTFLFGVCACLEGVALASDKRRDAVIGVGLFVGLFVAFVSDGAQSLLGWDSIPSYLLMGIPLFLAPLITELVPEISGRPARRILHAILVAVWLVLPVLACVAVDSDPLGAHILLCALVMVKGSDTGGYIVGRSVGRIPLHPISPRKTVEGLLVAIGASVLAGAIYSYALADPGFPVSQACFIGVLVALAGQLTDLQESALKRAAGVKDSGRTIPGLGGVLDMMDSLILTIPLVFWLRTLWY